MCPSLKCRFCTETFSYEPLRVAHEKVHTDDEPLTCQACGKTFRHHGKLEFHVEHCHGNTSSDETDENNNSRSSTMTVTEHFIDLTKDTSSSDTDNDKKEIQTGYVCDLCPEAFDAFDDFTFHLQSHFLGRNHVCDTCSESFLSMQDLQRHVASYHTKVKKYECAVCLETFPSILALEDHAASHSKFNFDCNLCKKSYSHSNSLQRHKWSAHSWSPFKCEDCGKIMQFKAQLNKHRTVYHDVGKEDYKHKCRVCKKKFREKHQLKDHLTTHSGVTYDCQLCGVAYKKKETLSKHVVDVHQHPENVTCKVCRVQLRNRSALLSHMKMHERERRMLEQAKHLQEFP